MEQNKIDPEKLKLIFNEYYPRLVAVACRLLYNRKDAEDVVSHCFIKLMNMNKESIEETNMWGLLYTIVKNLCFDHWRKAKRNKTFLVSGDEEEIYEYGIKWAGEQTVADNYETEKEEMEKLLKMYVQKLPTRQREVFTLRFYEKKSAQETADKLLITVQTVHNTYSEAKENLKEMTKADRSR